MVGGSDLARAQGSWAVADVIVQALLLLVAPAWGTAATAVVVMSPSVVHSARKAVTMAVHSFVTWFWAMAPHFRVGRFAYFPHDVYRGGEVVDRRPRRVDLLMNTTRMGASSPKRDREGPK
jgi:hypothetical protein